MKPPADKSGADGTTYRLLLRSVPHGIDETIRLRRCLKTMLRAFGFKALRVERVKESTRGVPEDAGLQEEAK
jgi:hypothetical protein